MNGGEEKRNVVWGISKCRRREREGEEANKNMIGGQMGEWRA